MHFALVIAVCYGPVRGKDKTISILASSIVEGSTEVATFSVSYGYVLVYLSTCLTERRLAVGGLIVC